MIRIGTCTRKFDMVAGDFRFHALTERIGAATSEASPGRPLHRIGARAPGDPRQPPLARELTPFMERE
jgi:hypothetical protein